jgi:hypothetical protein
VESTAIDNYSRAREILLRDIHISLLKPNIVETYVNRNGSLRLTELPPYNGSLSLQTLDHPRNANVIAVREDQH